MHLCEFKSLDRVILTKYKIAFNIDHGNYWKRQKVDVFVMVCGNYLCNSQTFPHETKTNNYFLVAIFKSVNVI